MKKSSSYRAQRRRSRFSRRSARVIVRHYNPTIKLKHAFLPEREGEGYLRRKRGECLLLLGARWGSY